MQTTAPSPQIRYVINEMMLVSGDSNEDVLVPSFGGHTIEFSVTTAPAFALRRPDGVFLICDRVADRAVIADPGLFQLLVDEWHIERGASSSITEMVLCPSYQRIIGMGVRAVPLILRRLEAEGGNPDHWGWALNAITGDNPIPDEAAGNTVAIAEAWLSWGRHGYAW